MSKPWFARFFIMPSTSDSDSDNASAETGQENAEAQFGLGLKYATAAGPARDYPRAAYWYRKAAEQDHAMAQLNLGLMYAEGQGVAKDEAQAFSWIRKGAERGDAGAQFHLGTRCHRASMTGSLVTAGESRIEAFKWFNLSASQGYKNSDASCERMAISMTRDEVTEGNRRVAAFVATKAAA
jgi:TPR repeat protein